MTEQQCWSEFWQKIAAVYAELDHPTEQPQAA